MGFPTITQIGIGDCSNSKSIYLDWIEKLVLSVLSIHCLSTHWFSSHLNSLLPVHWSWLCIWFLLQHLNLFKGQIKVSATAVLVAPLSKPFHCLKPLKWNAPWKESVEVEAGEDTRRVHHESDLCAWRWKSSMFEREMREIFGCLLTLYRTMRCVMTSFISPIKLLQHPV